MSFYKSLAQERSLDSSVEFGKLVFEMDQPARGGSIIRTVCVSRMRRMHFFRDTGYIWKRVYILLKKLLKCVSSVSCVCPVLMFCSFTQILRQFEKEAIFIFLGKKTCRTSVTVWRLRDCPSSFFLNVVVLEVVSPGKFYFEIITPDLSVRCW